MSNLVLLAVVVLISIYITIRAFIKFRWEYMGWNVFTITYFGGFIGWPLITLYYAFYSIYPMNTDNFLFPSKIRQKNTRGENSSCLLLAKQSLNILSCLFSHVIGIGNVGINDGCHGVA